MISIDRNSAEQCLRAAVSGSFHRHMDAIMAAVQELTSLSVRVLSPADPRIVGCQGEFLFVASDRVRSVRLVQDRHLEAIRAADFLWLVCPDGYIGQSASMELGFAAAVGVPMFSSKMPADLTLRQYVSVVRTPADAIQEALASNRTRRSDGILIDPHASLEAAHEILDRVGSAFAGSNAVYEPAALVRQNMAELWTRLKLPTYTQ
jgi:hypothetical protein